MEKFKSENGITLIALAVTVIVMIIISVGLSATMTTNIEMKNYNKFKEDIITLSEATKLYYLNNGTLPVATDKVLTSIDVPSKDKNPNDNDKYYYIDMRLIPDAETYFGEGNKDGTFTSTDNDLYVVNERSLMVYYLKGAVLNGERHYTSVDDYSDGGFASDYYSKTDLPIISAVSMKSDGEDSTRANLGDTVTLKFISNYTLTQNPTVVIDGQDVTSICIWNGNICTATYKVTSAADSNGNSKEGKKVEFSISNYSADNRTGTTISDVNFGKSLYFGLEGKYVDGVTIPNGFVYVGGTKTSGLVISDATTDKEKYKGQETVGTDLVGNQFVWIPVENVADYKRVAYSTNIASGKIDTSTNSEKINYSIVYKAYYTEALNTDEKDSVEKYHGYYIGRYEAGDKNSTEGRTLRSSSSSVTNFITIKAGQAPYNYVTQNQAQGLAEGFYKQQGYTDKTRLCSSYAWDTAIKFIQKTNNDYGDSSKEGNYKNVSFTYTDITGASRTKANGATILVPTGQTTATNNIFDLGGNVMEWTTERYSISSTPYTDRGGYYNYTCTETSAGYRLNNSNNALESRGFRITLFM